MREYGHDQSRPKVSNHFAVFNSFFFSLLVDAMKGCKIDPADHTKQWERFPTEGACCFLELIHTSCT